MKSCMDRVNAKIPAVRMPGTLTGSVTCRTALQRLHPSTMAASSISIGMRLKKPIRSQRQNGIVNVGYTSTRAQNVFCKLKKLVTSWLRGRKRRMGGIRYVMKIPMPSHWPPLKRSLARA